MNKWSLHRCYLTMEEYAEVLAIYIKYHCMQKKLSQLSKKREITPGKNK